MEVGIKKFIGPEENCTTPVMGIRVNPALLGTGNAHNHNEKVCYCELQE